MPIGFFCVFGAALLSVIIYPHLDLIVSGWFYKSGQGFYLENERVFILLHRLAIKGAWYLGGLFAVLVPIAFFRRNGLAGLSAKGWFFLLLALLVGPVLIANATFKDHWGRARPREVKEFAGNENFSPALIPQHQDYERNGSFVAGDGAFGAFLPSVAYLVPLRTRRRQSRYVFWGCMAVGSLFGVARIIMGAHFFSDVLFATLFMLITSAGVHAFLYGWNSTRHYWRVWLGDDHHP